MPTARPVPVAPAPPAPVSAPVAPQPVAPAAPQPVAPQPVAPLAPQPVAPAAPQPVAPVVPQPGVPQPAPVQRAAAPQPVPTNAPARPVTINPATPQSEAAKPTPQPASPASRPVPVSKADAAKTNRPMPVENTGTLVREHAEDDEEGEAKQPADKAVRAAPPWLVSLVVHMVLFVVLAIFTLPFLGQADRVLEILPVYAEELGEQLEDDQLESLQLDPALTDPVLSEDNVAVEDPFAAPPEITDVVFDATTASSDIAAPTIGLALTGREKGMKKALLGAYGGTATTEAAVAMALEWLKRNQERDGMWSLKGPYSNGSLTENRLAATAMALLAFQGAGHTHQSGEHKRVVDRAWKTVIKLQDADGNFFRGGPAPAHHRLYTQAQITIALCELYGMTKDSAFRDPAQKALDYAIKAQSPAGGWRYVPREDADTSVTGWFVMALQSGLMAGLEVQSPALDSISKYLDNASTDGGSGYAYKPGQAETPTMTAEGLLCRQYLGWKKDDPRLVKGVDRVAGNPINWRDQNVYYWYYATQVMHHMEGQHWNDWNEVLRETVPAKQVKTGKEKGSWDPMVDRWGNHGGRLYTTCLCTYMLEVYYRHLPIYRHPH
ncbi:MAG: squalene--hopene cyclase [Blastopirellula sp.]|nr:squalene--hopene cyclase [Blastopirellula sp.]